MANKNNKNRRKRRAKPKNSSKKRSAEISSSDEAKAPQPAPAEPLPPQLPAPAFNATPTTDALASMNAQNLYHLSLVCFSFSLILFASTYHMITNNGGTAAVFGFSTTALPTQPLVPEEIPVVDIPSAKTNSSLDHDELLIGYKLLHHTLKKESQLKYLHWLRNASFRGPKGSLKSVLTTVYQTSQTRLQELEGLFVDHSPEILLQDTPKSAMGDSLQDDVEKASTGELVPLPFSSSSSSSLPHLQWGIRFAFIQAQATRMVVALSTSLLKFETNEDRKQWLVQLADEFEDIRETLVESTVSNLGEDSWTN